METPALAERKRSHVARNAYIAIGAAIVAVSGFAYYGDSISTTQKFQETYTKDGACLDKTPYDPDEGANLHLADVDGQEVLTVVPRDANSYKPAVLFFSVDQKNFWSRPHLTFADHQTGSFLAQANCPDQPDGY